MGIGAVCHTLNPRLFPEQLCYIINHAADRILIVDETFLPVLARPPGQDAQVERFIVLGEPGRVAGLGFRGALASETLIEALPPDGAWGGFDENTACGLCYTSGTTGNPKGVLYSHRSNFLHTLVTLQRDVMGLSVRDTVLAVVPMFHANAWGLAFSCPAVGRQAGHARPAHGRAGDPGTARDREGHHVGRGADRLADAARPPARDRAKSRRP